MMEKAKVNLERLTTMVEESSDELVVLRQALVRVPTINTGCTGFAASQQ